MKKLYFSTVFRYAPVDQGGELVKVDWESKKVENIVPVSPKALKFEDPNPRGNSRGGRGIAVIDGKVIMAGYCELQVFDLELNPLYNISHNLMSGLHEVFHDSGQHLWVTSTSLNTALLLDLDSGELLDQVWPQEIPAFQERWGLKPRLIDKNEDNRIRFLYKNIERDPCHLHFNAFCTWKGERFGLFNRFGAVVNLTRNTVVFEDQKIKGAHNLIIDNDGTIFVNDTRNQAVNLYNMSGELKKRINLLPLHAAGEQVKRYKLLAPARKLMTRMGFGQQDIVMPLHSAGEQVKRYKLLAPARKLMTRMGFGLQDIVMPFFVRGMDLHEELLYIGISPASVLCLDWQTGKLVDSFTYTEDIRKAVHGLRVVLS